MNSLETALSSGELSDAAPGFAIFIRAVNLRDPGRDTELVLAASEDTIKIDDDDTVAYAYRADVLRAPVPSSSRTNAISRRSAPVALGIDPAMSGTAPSHHWSARGN